MKNTLSCLLIDDDVDERDFFNLAIQELDTKIQLHYSSTAREALENLKAGIYHPDYIFLDMNMMPINGLECLKEIKKIPKVVDTPVIIYSTTINEDIIYHTLQAGAFDHFEKPLNKDALVKYLKRVFQVQN